AWMPPHGPTWSSRASATSTGQSRRDPATSTYRCEPAATSPLAVAASIDSRTEGRAQEVARPSAAFPIDISPKTRARGPAEGPRPPASPRPTPAPKDVTGSRSATWGGGLGTVRGGGARRISERSGGGGRGAGGGWDA